MKAKPKRKVLRSKKYLQYIRDVGECWCCNAEVWDGKTIVPHHWRTGTDGGTGLKPSDCYCLPTCTKCHDKIHRMGESAFLRNEIGPEGRRDVSRCVQDEMLMYLHDYITAGYISEGFELIYDMADKAFKGEDL